MGNPEPSPVRSNIKEKERPGITETGLGFPGEKA